MIMGERTDFIKEIDEGDLIIPIEFSTINETPESLSVNLKKNYFLNYCKVEKIFSKSILKTDGNCVKIFKYKGDYLIKKKFNKYPENIIFQNNNDFLFFEDKRDLNSHIKSNIEKKDDSIIVNENYFSPLDLDVPEILNINTRLRNFFDKQYFFNFGFLVKNLGNTVFRFKLEKM